MADVVVSSTTGGLKGVNLLENSFSNFIPLRELKPKEDEIACMCWTGAEDWTEVLCAQMNRELKLFDSVANSFTSVFRAEGGTGPVKGMDIVGGNKIATAVQSGLVKVWELSGESSAEFEAGDNLCRMRRNPFKEQCLATGGKENLLKIWDLNSTEKPTFTAKNVRPDWLQLRVPVWDTDFRFVPDSEQVITCTGHHQIRLYDPRGQQRRPVREVTWAEQPFTTLSLCSNPMQVVAGNTHGGMALFDLRGKPRMVQVYKGFSGSIRAIECHPTQPLVASCGVDRFVRVHHLESRLMLHKIYCKSPLSNLLLRKDLTILNADPKEPRKDDEQLTATRPDESDDEIWAEMDRVGEKRDKKTLKRKEKNEENGAHAKKERRKDTAQKRRSDIESLAPTQVLKRKKLKTVAEVCKEGLKNTKKRLNRDPEKKKMKKVKAETD